MTYCNDRKEAGREHGGVLPRRSRGTTHPAGEVTAPSLRAAHPEEKARAGWRWAATVGPPRAANYGVWSFDKFVKRDQTSPHHYVIQAAGTHIHEPINASDIMYGPVYAHRKPRTRT